MAGSSFFALFDDISTLLDDIATMTKVAARKTTGVLGDDLALNAEQVSGVRADRELPVVWAVAKGSLLNKAILVPVALALSVFLPWLVTPLLMLGGAYLCFEGFEKILHAWQHRKHKSDPASISKGSISEVAPMDPVQHEKAKVKGAIRTDFVLSAEIIVISLGTVKEASFLQQAIVLVGISFIMTLGVYGLVALIVKLDDMGLVLLRKPSFRWLGQGLVSGAPWLMKFLSLIGTVAMFMVGGGILLHGLPHPQGWLANIPEFILGLTTGLVAGAILATAVEIWHQRFPKG